jgi:hypothetical protein
MKQILVLIFLIVLLISCKKDELSGDKEIMIGTWKWEYTVREHYGDFQSYSDTLNPNSVSKSFSIKFEQKGIGYLFEDGEKTKKFRIVFNEWREGNTATIQNSMYFSFDIDKEELFGNVNPDTLVTYVLFPYDRETGTDNIYVKNYFVRE